MWFCFLFTHVDPKRQNISPKLIRALVWFMAALSPIVVCSSYAIALGINVNITLLTYLIIGLMLLILAIIWKKQNRTIVLAFGFHGHCPVKKTGIAHTVSAPDCLSFVAWLWSPMDFWTLRYCYFSSWQCWSLSHMHILFSYLKKEYDVHFWNMPL